MNNEFYEWDKKRLRIHDEHNYFKISDDRKFESKDCYLLKEPTISNEINNEEIVVVSDDEIVFSSNNFYQISEFDFPVVNNSSFPYNRLSENREQPWVLSVLDHFHKLETSLRKILVEIELYSFLNEESVKVYNRIILKKICRVIRKCFAQAHWNFECVILIHSHALNYLDADLLQIYTKGYTELNRTKKINILLHHINSEVSERNLVSRIDHESFLHLITKNLSLSEESFSLPKICSLLNTNNEGSKNIDTELEEIKMEALCPYPSSGPNMSIQNLICSALNRHAFNGNLTPSFVCLTYPFNCSAGRLCNHISYLNQMGNVSLESPEEQSCDTLRLRLRLFTRRVISVLEEQRSGPVFVVGFGLGGVLALISLLHLSNNISKLGLPSDDTNKDKNREVKKIGLSGVPISSNNSWLSGFISLGIPLLGIKGDRGCPMDPLLSFDSRYSGLFVVGSESRLGNEDHMRIFRNKLLNKSKQNNAEISPVGMRILSVKGADQFLRIRPSKAKKWMISQEMVDRSIGFHIAQFVGDCKQQFLAYQKNQLNNSSQSSTTVSFYPTISQSSPIHYTNVQGSPLSNQISEETNSPNNSLNSYNTAEDYQNVFGPPSAKYMRHNNSSSDIQESKTLMVQNILTQQTNRPSSSSSSATIFRTFTQSNNNSHFITNNNAKAQNIQSVTSNRFAQMQRSQPRILQTSGSFPNSLNVVTNLNSLLINTKNKPLPTFAISLQNLQNKISNQENQTSPRTLSFLNNLPLNQRNVQLTVPQNQQSWETSNSPITQGNQNRLSRRKTGHAEQRKNHLLRKQMYEENPDEF